MHISKMTESKYLKQDDVGEGGPQARHDQGHLAHERGAGGTTTRNTKVRHGVRGDG